MPNPPGSAAATVDVDVAGGRYHIHLRPGADPSDFAATIGEVLGDAAHVVLVYDTAVGSIARLYADALSIRVDSVAVASGESSKSIAGFESLLRSMLEAKTDRRSVVIALGGGVVGDLAGFAAASFARGVRLVQVPTTLLSMVDSSVGGKTGINLPGAKNMVGAFWQPSLVWIDTASLSTLPAREYVSGLAEVIKYGVIADSEFFGFLEANADSLIRREPEVLNQTIRRCCQIKADVVTADERETTGRRAILNYGHTFAHAIEATTGYGTWLHGEAVSIGMTMAASLAIDRGLCDPELLRRQTAWCQSVGLPVAMPGPDVDAMIEAMASDKKVAAGRLHFILPTRIGEVIAVPDVPRPQVVAAIESAATERPFA